MDEQRIPRLRNACAQIRKHARNGVDPVALLEAQARRVFDARGPRCAAGQNRQNRKEVGALGRVDGKRPLFVRPHAQRIPVLLHARAEAFQQAGNRAIALKRTKVKPGKRHIARKRARREEESRVRPVPLDRVRAAAAQLLSAFIEYPACFFSITTPNKPRVFIVIST